MKRFTWTLILIIVVFTLSYIIEADDRFWCPERERTFSYVLFLPSKLAIGMQSSKKLLLKNHYDSLIITVLYKQPAGKLQYKTPTGSFAWITAFGIAVGGYSDHRRRKREHGNGKRQGV